MAANLFLAGSKTSPLFVSFGHTYEAHALGSFGSAGTHACFSTQPPTR